MTPTDRRRFLKQSAALAFAATATATARVRAAEPLPIIDTHQHLWDLSKFRLPWLDSAPKLNRSFVTDDYREATRGLNVEKAVYMEVDVDPSEQDKEADAIVNLIRSRKTP